MRTLVPMPSLRGRALGLAPRTAEALTWRHAVLLLASMLAATATSSIVMGAAFLLPCLHTQRGLSLAHAGAIVAMPQVGILCALLPWGWVVDRTGERAVLLVGLILTGLATAAAGLADSLTGLGALLFAAGAAAASTNVASGRVVVGWFPPARRGLAMGIRQMSTPLGAALAAMTIPPLARESGIAAALAVPALACALATVLVAGAVADPARPPRGTAAPHLTANPYAGEGYLWRIHGTSVLLVVPQAVMSAFMLVWLMTAHGWAAGAAGLAVTVGQLLGAGGRIAVGAWSDRVGSRMRPLRAVAIAAAVAAAMLAVTDALPGPGRAAAVVLAIALTVISVADNGLAFTAVAERAGPFWSGRALSVQNTSQYIAMAATAPTVGWLVENHGYPFTFALTALVAALAVPLVPRRDRPTDEETAREGTVGDGAARDASAPAGTARRR